MKITVEVDLTPQEALELFSGNVDNLQKAMLNMLNSQMQPSPKAESNVAEFWRSMAQTSQQIFENYCQGTQATETKGKARPRQK